MNEDKRDTLTDYACRGMLSILDLRFPTEQLNNEAKSEKWFLRKRILDYMHKIELLNGLKKEE